MDEKQEQFLKTLQMLQEEARAHKDTLEYDEILKAFEGMELGEDKIDDILEFMEKNNIDVLQGKSIDESISDGEPDGGDEDVRVGQIG